MWPCNDYNKRGLSADFTLRYYSDHLKYDLFKASGCDTNENIYSRPNLNRKINALRYADKHGAAIYYNSLAGKQKTHRKQVDLIVPREVCLSCQHGVIILYYNL